MTKYEPVRGASSRSLRSPHPPPQRSRAPRPHPPPVSSFTASTWSPSARTVSCAPSLLGELQGIRVAIHHDDVGRGERSQALDADVAEPACADHRAGRTRISRGIALRTAWYAVMPASASAATSFGSRGRVELDAGARRRQQQLGHPAVAVEPGEHALAAMHVSPARQARHSPQVGVGCRITVSPTATFVTAEPTSCTQPAFSCPRCRAATDVRSPPPTDRG